MAIKSVAALDYPAATNLVTNSDAVTNTTGWSAGGTNTLARSTAQALPDASTSFKCTYADSTSLALIGLTLTAAQHFGGAYVYVPTGWDGGDIRCVDSGFAGAGEGAETKWISASSPLNQWVRIGRPVTPDSGDLIGLLLLFASSAPSAGKFIYMAGAQMELGGTPTPRIITDGGTASRAAAITQRPLGGVNVAVG